MKAGAYRLQVERESPGRLFVKVVQVKYGRMVWNQLPNDTQFRGSVVAAIGVIDSARGKATSEEQIENIVGAVQRKLGVS